jgi:hypothetical protein
MNHFENQKNNIDISDEQWISIYTLGGVTTIIALLGISLDVIIGNITGGNFICDARWPFAHDMDDPVCN